MNSNTKSGISAAPILNQKTKRIAIVFDKMAQEDDDYAKKW